MPTFKSLLVDIADIKADLGAFAALGDLVAAWPQLAKELDDITSVEALLDRLMTDVDSDPMKQAFGAVGAEDLRVALGKVVARIKSVTDDIPPDVKLLLRRTSEFQEVSNEHPGQVAWTLVDRAQSIPLADGVSLKIGGKAELEFEAGDSGFNAGGSGGSGARVLRVAARGDLSAEGAAKLPFSGGVFEASASAEAAFGLSGFFEVSGDRLYALDVARVLTDLPNPFDFEAVGHAFDTTDLSGLAYQFNGATDGQLQVSLADGLSLGHGVTAMLGATVGVGMSQTAAHALVLRRGPKNDAGQFTIRAQLTRRRVEGRDFKGSIGLTVDISALTGRVHQVLKSAIGQWDKGLAEIKPFLSPGTALKSVAAKALNDAAGRLVGQDALRKALVRDLSGALGIDPHDDLALAGWVETELAAALDRAGILAKAEGAANSALSELKRSLPAFAEAAFGADLEAELDKLATAATDAFNGAVTAAVNAAGVAKVGSALKGAGARSQAVYNKLDDALAGARELIEKYDALFKKVLASAEAATKAKITATLLLEESREARDEYQFGGVLLDRSESAKAVFDALTQGKIKALLPILEGQSAAGFSLDRTSTLRRLTQSTSKRGFEVVLLNFGGVAGADLLTAEAESLVDGDGNVQIDSRARLEKNFKGLREARKVVFAEAAKLVLAKGASGEDDITRALELGVSVLHEDKSLKRSEVEGFIGSLVAGGLLPKDASSQAATQFNRWVDVGSDHLRADIAAKLWLSGSGVRRLLQLDRRDGAGRLERAAAVAIIEQGLAAWNACDLVDLPTFRLGAQVARSRYLEGAPAALSEAEVVYDLYIDKRDRPLTQYTGPGAAQNDRLVDGFRSAAIPMFSLVKLIQRMGDVYNAGPDWPLDRFRKAQEEIGEETKDWLRINSKFFFWIGAEVHPRVVALFKVMADMGGLSGATGVGLVMTHRPKGKDPETAVIV